MITLEEALKAVGEGFLEDDRPGTVHLAETLWEAAIEGNMRAAKMILEYSIGRPKLALEVTDTKQELSDALQQALGQVYGTEEDDVIQWDADGNPIERAYNGNSD